MHCIINDHERGNPASSRFTNDNAPTHLAQLSAIFSNIQQEKVLTKQISFIADNNIYI
jgi:hypothetical protein